MPIQSVLCPLDVVYCPVPTCFRVCYWAWIPQGHSQTEAVVCKRHGVSGALAESQSVLPYTFAVADAVFKEHKCIRCTAKPSNADCSFMLCLSCCAELRLPCWLRTHVTAGAERFPGVTPSAVVPVPIRTIRVADRVKVRVYVKHIWQESPVRSAGFFLYAASCYVPRTIDDTIAYEELGGECRRLLKIDGLSDDTLFEEDVYDQGAFYDGYAVFSRVRAFPTLKLVHFVRFEELGRHVPLQPEEADLCRDWDTLGSVDAWVTCCFVSEPLLREPVKLSLPRRRLIYRDCTFFLSDLTEQGRALLGLTGVDDARIHTGPGESIPAVPHTEGVIEKGVDITLYIMDAW